MGKEVKLLSKDTAELEKIKLVKEILNIETSFWRNPKNLGLILTTLIGFGTAVIGLVSKESAVREATATLQAELTKTQGELALVRKKIEEGVSESEEALSVVLKEVLKLYAPHQYLDSKDRWQLDNMDRFKKLVDLVVSSGIESEDAYYYLAIQALNTGDPMKSHQYFSILAEDFPNNYLYFIGLMKAAAKTGEVDIFVDASVAALNAPPNLRQTPILNAQHTLMRDVLYLADLEPVERNVVENNFILKVLAKSPYNWHIGSQFRVWVDETDETTISIWDETLKGFFNVTPNSAIVSKLYADSRFNLLKRYRKACEESNAPDWKCEKSEADIINFNAAVDGYLQAIRMTEVSEQKREIHLRLSTHLIEFGDDPVAALYHFNLGRKPEELPSNRIIECLKQHYPEWSSFSPQNLVEIILPLFEETTSQYKFQDGGICSHGAD